MNEWDIRQLNLMLQKLEDFEKDSNQFLPELVGESQGFLSALEKVENNWREKFRAEIVELDIIYSIALYKERNFNSEDKIRVNEAIKNMKNLLLEEKLNQAKQFKGEMGILAEENWIICPYCFEPLEPPQIDLVLTCPKCDQCFRNPLKQ